jgi:hypothetical protein
MLERISSAELTAWMAFYRIEAEDREKAEQDAKEARENG